MKRYVQHISGQGEKWLIRDCKWNEDSTRPYWLVGLTDCGTEYVAFPKREYRLCEPTEEWEDVSGSYEADQVPYDVLHYNDLRLRKIDHLHNGPAFIVERRKS